MQPVTKTQGKSINKAFLKSRANEGKICSLKKSPLLIALIICPILLLGQKSDSLNQISTHKHYISINPFNVGLFQQAGLTYEYKEKKKGYGLAGGYIYANNSTYNNYFIAGPTSVGSLGDYHGYFVIPHLAFYLSEFDKKKHTNQAYVKLIFVYRYMQIDTTKPTVWEQKNDTRYYSLIRDKVNIYGGFIDIGYRHLGKHFFYDLNFGVGVLGVNHDAIMYGISSSFKPPFYHYETPIHEQVHEINFTINFSFNIGFAF